MGSKPPKQEVMESGLSKEQLKILQGRESLYQSYIKPELKDYYQSAKEFELNNNFLNFDHMPDIAKVNSDFAFNSGTSQLQKLLSQRGNEADVSAYMGTTKQIAGSNAFNQAQLQAILQHNDLIGKENQNTLNEQNVRLQANNMLLSQAPRTTQAAPVYFYQKPRETGMVAQIGQAIMGSMGSMGGMMGGMGGMSGGFGGGASTGGAQASGAASSAATAAAGSFGGAGGYGASMGAMMGGY